MHAQEYWTTQRIADEAKRAGRPVSREYLRQLCEEGRLKAIKPGRDWLVTEQDARDWLAEWLERR